MHQIGAYQTGDGERALNGALGFLRQAQEQESDQRDGELNAHGVLAAPEKMPDLQRLLDPAEKQFNLPAPLVERGDLLGGRVEVVMTRRKPGHSVH